MSLTKELAEESLAATPTGHSVRVINRRVGLPSSRAVVGALLVTISVVGLFVAFNRSQADTRSPYVVVASTVAAGAEIQPGDLAVRQMDLGEIGPRTLSAVDQAVGSIAVQTLVPGQLLQEADILDPSVGSLESAPRPFEVSFAVDKSRALLGDLTPGELVDVVATFEVAGNACTSVVVPAAQIISARTAGSGQFASDDSVDLTLSVAGNDEVLGLVHALDEAHITVVRATRADGTHLAGSFCADTSQGLRTDGES